MGLADSLFLNGIAGGTLRLVPNAAEGGIGGLILKYGNIAPVQCPGAHQLDLAFYGIPDLIAVHGNLLVDGNHMEGPGLDAVYAGLGTIGALILFQERRVEGDAGGAAGAVSAAGQGDDVGGFPILVVTQLVAYQPGGVLGVAGVDDVHRLIGAVSFAVNGHHLIFLGAVDRGCVITGLAAARIVQGRHILRGVLDDKAVLPQVQFHAIGHIHVGAAAALVRVSISIIDVFAALELVRQLTGQLRFTGSGNSYGLTRRAAHADAEIGVFVHTGGIHSAGNSFHAGKIIVGIGVQKQITGI